MGFIHPNTTVGEIPARPVEEASIGRIMHIDRVGIGKIKPHPSQRVPGPGHLDQERLTRAISARQSFDIAIARQVGGIRLNRTVQFHPNALGDCPARIENHLLDAAGERRSLILSHPPALDSDLLAPGLADNHPVDRFDLPFLSVFQGKLGDVDPDEFLKPTRLALAM